MTGKKRLFNKVKQRNQRVMGSRKPIILEPITKKDRMRWLDNSMSQNYNLVDLTEYNENPLSVYLNRRQTIRSMEQGEHNTSVDSINDPLQEMMKK